MKRSNKSVRQYYMTLLGMLGEIFSMHASRHAPAAPSTAGDELRLMMKDGLIRYHRHQDKKRTFRVSDPAGFEYMEQLDERLLEHAEMMIGKTVRYTGSRAYRLKKRREADIMFHYLSSGIEVDGAVMDSERNIRLASPSLVDAEEILRTAPKDTPTFLSGPLLKRRSEDMHQRREMSTSTGTLFSEGGVYTTYSISSSKHRWIQDAERVSADSVLRLYQKATGSDQRMDGRQRAIFYTETADIATELIEKTGFAGKKMDPLSIFRLTYLVPLESPEHAMDITKMLTIPDWRLKTDEILGLSPSGKHDGETGGGKKIYNLLCCNLAKIHEVEGEIKRGKCRIVIHEWQKEAFEKLYATELDAVVLSEKHFKGLLLTITEQRDKE